MKEEKGSATIFVLVGLLFMTSYLLILYGSNVNKEKALGEQINIISGIYYKDSDNESYEKIYGETGNINLISKTNSTTDGILILSDSGDAKLINYTIYGSNVNIENASTSEKIYEKLDYISTSGTQYINTQFYPDANTNAKYKYMITAKSGTYGPHILSSKTYFFPLIRNNSSSPIFAKRGSSEFNSTKVSFALNKTYEVDAYTNGIVINGTNIGNNTSTGSKDSVPLYLGAYGGTPTDTGYIFKGNLYYCKIYNGANTNDSNLARNLIPCRRLSDNVLGMYDDVEKKFYTNDGTGTFSAGTSLNEYIEQTKNGYVEKGDYNKYRVVVSKNEISNTYEIELTEPLRQVGNYQDYIDFKTKKVVRNVGIIESYNGERITTDYLSNTGSLDNGATVFYGLTTPKTESVELPTISLFEEGSTLEVYGINRETSNKELINSKFDVEYYALGENK